MRNVALDFGGKIHLCEVAGGKVVRRKAVREIWDLRDVLGPDTPPARVAVEACREAWRLVEVLKEWGHEPVVVDTTRVEKLGIGHHGRKNDRLDAQLLATELEKGNIPKAHVLSLHRQELRAKQSVRRGLVETRAQYIVMVHGFVRVDTLKSFAKTDPRDFISKVEQLQLTPKTVALIKPLLTLIEQLNAAIAVVDVELEALALKEPATLRMRTVCGVGAVVSTAFVSVIDYPGRFKSAHQVGSYVGLVPSEDTSVKRRLGSITKEGNSYLRALLVQAAWGVIRSRGDDPLKVWALRVAERRGRRVAAVALARRLAGIMWAIWRDGTVYEAQRVGQASADGITRQAQSDLVVAQAMRTAARKTRRRLRAPKQEVAVR